MDDDDYKLWQYGYEDIEREWDDDWSDERKRDHYKNLEVYNDKEIEGRERAREEWGDDADEGHDDRIERLGSRGQLLNHAIAHSEGRYEYETRRMQDHQEIEEVQTWESEDDDGNEDAAEASGDDDGDEYEERVWERRDDSDMEIEFDSD